MICIRPYLKRDDADAISRIYWESWRFAYAGLLPQEYLDSIPQNRWTGYIRDCPQRVLLAMESGRPVGVITYGPARNAEFLGYCELVSLYLLPEFTRRGIGSALMDRAKKDCAEEGFRGMLLYVLEGNRSARAFYEKQGFLDTHDALEDCIGGMHVKEMRYALRFLDVEDGKEEKRGSRI